MSFIKRLGNVGRGWVSTQVKGLRGEDDPAQDAALAEAEATLRAGARRPRDARAVELAEDARAARQRAEGIAAGEAADAEPPAELDPLGLPEPKPRTL